MSNDPGSEAGPPAVDGVCAQCGFDYDELDHAAAVDRLNSFGRRYTAPMTRGLPGESLDELVRAHPLAGAWSTLEYACHVRDVFAVQQERLDRALNEDRPAFERMGGGIGRDELAVRDRYNEQEPTVVAEDLARNGAALAGSFEALSDDQWPRRFIYGYPQSDDERDVTWLAAHTVHEGHHHLLDVGRVLRAARGRG
jgi:hypothetical protein